MIRYNKGITNADCTQEGCFQSVEVIFMDEGKEMMKEFHDLF